MIKQPVMAKDSRLPGWRVVLTAAIKLLIVVALYGSSTQSHAQGMKLMYYPMIDPVTSFSDLAREIDEVFYRIRPTVAVLTGFHSESDYHFLLSIPIGLRSYQVSAFIDSGRAVLVADTEKVEVLRHLQVSGDVDADVWIVRLVGYQDSIAIACVNGFRVPSVLTDSAREALARDIRRALWRVGGRYLVVSGSFGFTRSDEPAFAFLRDSTVDEGTFGVPLLDPYVYDGEWNDTIAGARLHTFATRVDSSAQLYGLTRRVDFTLCSQAVVAELLIGPTVKAWGNDGSLFGQSLTRNHATTYAPYPQLEALSTHLPTTMSLTFHAPASTVAPERQGSDSVPLNLSSAGSRH